MQLIPNENVVEEVTKFTFIKLVIVIIRSEIAIIRLEIVILSNMLVKIKIILFYMHNTQFNVQINFCKISNSN